MSTTRLTFLYPHLFRGIRISEPSVQTVRQCRPHHPSKTAARATFATTSRKSQRVIERHGKAVEPLPPPSIPVQAKEGVKEAASSPAEEVKKEGGKEAATSATRQPTKPKQNSKATQDNPKEEPESSKSAALSKETEDAARLPGDEGADESKSQGQEAEKEAAKTPRQEAAENTKSEDGPLETVLHMQAPADPPPTIDSQIPNLHTTPPYVHHFDSYTLVKGIEGGGFTPEQAVTAMKGIRSLLALNLDVAKEGLVSKSDVENETYLFRAACSELRTEIANMRRANDEKMRRDRTLLQHEVDILGQKMTQELQALKDDLNGMFNDRKMAVRGEQRAMDSAIQEINYKIAVLLNSDAKSEVEGLRWVLSRRSVLAIVFMAIMVLASLRYNSYRAHQVEQERLRLEKEAQLRKHHRMTEGGTQTDDLPAGTAAELSAN